VAPRRFAIEEQHPNLDGFGHRRSIHDVELPADVVGDVPQLSLLLADRWIDVERSADSEPQAGTVERRDGVQVSGAEGDGVELADGGVFAARGGRKGVGNGLGGLWPDRR
jgi:hypothetical protein